MAAPNDAAIEDMTGSWVMDKALSPVTDAMLVLQGISWVLRKAIGLATVTLNMRQALTINPTTSAQTVEITVAQSTNTGLGATSTKQYLDWSEVARDDNIFGKTIIQSRLISGVPSPGGKSRPDLHIQTKINDPNIEKFLKGEIGEDLQPSEGYLVEVPQKEFPSVNGEAGLWIQVVMRSEDKGWMAEQVWAFELINGERRYVRRTVVSDHKGKYQLGRIVYSFRGRDGDLRVIT